MNQQAQPSPREHHFYVAIAKFLFHHPEHGIVSVRDPIKNSDAERYGLSPLILYGLTVAGLPIRWMTFTPVDQPRAFRDVLLDAWRNAEGLRGRPDILRINRHLATASPELVGEMVIPPVLTVLICGGITKWQKSESRSRSTMPRRNHFQLPCAQPRTPAGGGLGSTTDRTGLLPGPSRPFAGTLKLTTIFVPGMVKEA